MAGSDGRALSERQKEVLGLIDQRYTIKEIAAELGVSETRINQHIDALKRRLGANSHRELAERYRELLAPFTPAPFRKSVERSPQLAIRDEARSLPGRVADSGLALADVHAFALEAPWAKASEQPVVPPALDGDNAVLVRLAVVAAIVFGTLASLVLAITAADSLSGLVGSRPDTQQID